MSKSPLEEYLSSLQRKQAELDKFMDTFSQQAVNEPDGFKRVMDKMIVKYAEIMKDLFENVSMLAKAQTGLNNKIESLTELIMELSEVKNNPDIQKRIDEIFKRYDDSTGRLK